MNNDELINNIFVYRNNPQAIMSTIYRNLSEGTDNNHVVPDATNTFAYLIECMSSCSSALAINAESLNRRLYPSLAQSESEIYHHLSDRNMNNVFAQPSRAKFDLVLNVGELVNKNLATTQSGVRKLTIPRDTKISLGEYSFSLQYPVDIRVRPHDGIDAVYDTEISNPFRVLESNVIETMVQTFDGHKYIGLTLDLLQYDTKIVEEPISRAAGFNKSISFTDDFFAARVFHYINNEWKELVTTHSELTYDIAIPTALLRVADNMLYVKIPPVYFTNALMGTKLKILVHNTKGDINVDLRDRVGEQVSIEYHDHLSLTPDIYKGPLGSIREISYTPFGRVSGGRDKLSFRDLKRLTIDNAFDSSDLPITNHQLSNKLSSLGYDIVKYIDNITNRTYVATRKLPKASDLLTASYNVPVMDTTIGSTVGTLYTDLVSLSLKETAKHTGNRLTLLPNTLYSLDNGILSIVPDSVRTSLNNSTPDVIANALNDRNYLYSPFYYVFDYNYNDFSVRSYHLAPVVTGRAFLDENDNVAFDTKTESINFEITDDSIDIYLEISSNVSLDEIGLSNIQLQLAYVPFNEVNRAYAVAEYVGLSVNENHLFKFRLETDFDFDVNNNLYTKNFRIIDGETERLLPTPLNLEFDVLIVVLNESMEDNALNSYKADYMIPESVDESYVATREGLNVSLGHYLDSLWDKSRTVRSTEQYLRHEQDVLAYYPKDVWELDPEVGSRVEKVHSLGDPIMVDGEHQVLYKKGSVVVDEDGRPVIKEDFDLQRELKLILLDARYLYATESTASLYLNEVVDEIVRWINEDIKEISNKLIEETELLFHPKKTYGLVNVFDEDGELVSIESEQILNIKLTVPKRVSTDSELKSAITRTVIETIDVILRNRTIALSDIISELRSVLNDDVYGIEITGLGGNSNITTMTLEDDSQTLSLAKELYIAPDSTIGIRNDISISFIKHSE